MSAKHPHSCHDLTFGREFYTIHKIIRWFLFPFWGKIQVYKEEIK